MGRAVEAEREHCGAEAAGDAEERILQAKHAGNKAWRKIAACVRRVRFVRTDLSSVRVAGEDDGEIELCRGVDFGWIVDECEREGRAGRRVDEGAEKALGEAGTDEAEGGFSLANVDRDFHGFVLEPAQAREPGGGADEFGRVVIAADGEGAEACAPGGGEFFERAEGGGFVAGVGHEVAGEDDEIDGGGAESLEGSGVLERAGADSFYMRVGEVENSEAFEFGGNLGVGEIEGLDGGGWARGAEGVLGS